MKTTILLEVEHSKPLPADHVGSVERHFYTWAYAKGCEVDVNAKAIRAVNDMTRCLGHGAGASGHQNRVDCVNCQRRLAPRPAGVPLSYMEPPSEFPCSMRIPANEVTAPRKDQGGSKP